MVRTHGKLRSAGKTEHGGKTMKFCEVARVDQAKLAAKLRVGEGKDVSHMFTHIWATAKRREMQALKALRAAV